MGKLPIYEVERRRIYAGAYPLWIVDRLVELGVRSFIDLTEPGELDARNPYASYQPSLDKAAEGRDVSVVRHNFPIEDFGIPAPGVLDAVLARIASDRDANRPSYIHCWGGYGRTGIVVGAWLVQQGRATEASFVDEIARLRGDLPSHFSSPVTREQIDYVRSFVTSRSS